MYIMEEIEINGFKHIKYIHKRNYSPGEAILKSKNLFEKYNNRRSIRTFSSRSVPKELILNLIRIAGTSPSGAHKQPWTFCAISSPYIKKEIRIAAEIEEKESYESRMSDRWKEDLKPLATDMHKPFLEDAPWLIIVFRKIYDLDNTGEKETHYYVNESVGISSGFLISAIHELGLVTLTHTPSPMNFLNKILERPSYEKPFLILPVGYPAEPTYVPNLERKKIDEISCFFE